MPIRVAINGFGRIGRAAFKISLEKENIDVVAINDLMDPEILVHLLKYDSAYGVFDKEVKMEIGELVVGKEKVTFLSETDPAKLPWKDMEIDVVLECTGLFTKDGAARAHIDAGAKAVIVSAPTKGEGNVQTFLRGVNCDSCVKGDVISMASCTTNCIAPVVDVIHSEFKILKSAMTTVHAATAGQNVVDGPPSKRKPDLRRARSALVNIIPTSTGAAQATAQVIPDLEGVFDGVALRVPIVTGSISDITMLVEKKTTAEEINEALTKASESSRYKGVLGVTNDPIVSSDIVKSSLSSLVDLSMTRVIDGDLVKVLSWYDNEWGYSTRLVEMVEKVV